MNSMIWTSLGADMSENNSRVEFGGSLSYKEFIRFQELLLAKWNKSYIVYPITALVLTLLFSGGQVLSSLNMFIREYAYWLLIFLVPFVLSIFFRKRAWRNIVDVQGIISGELDCNGLSWKTSHGLAKYAWNELLRFKQADDMLALFYTKRCAFYLPRSFFRTAEDWERAIDVCRNNVRAGRLG